MAESLIFLRPLVIFFDLPLTNAIRVLTWIHACSRRHLETGFLNVLFCESFFARNSIVPICPLGGS